MLGGFLVVPLLALALATTLTPDSIVVSLAPVAFAAAFAFGTLIWSGLGVALLLGKALVRLVTRGRLRADSTVRETEQLVPPGYGAYPALTTLAGIALGGIGGFTTDSSLVAVLGAWTAFGVACGLTLWLAAHHGYLPFLEPE